MRMLVHISDLLSFLQVLLSILKIFKVIKWKWRVVLSPTFANLFLLLIAIVIEI